MSLRCWQRTSQAVLMLCALALGAPSSHAAGQSEAEAEHTRLSEEMNKHARKARWHGVERAYESMLPLLKKGVLLTYRDHYQGAQSARELGNINQVYERLQAASVQKKTDDVQNWLADINANYGKVELVIPRKWKGKTLLSIDEMPLFPDQRSTIGLAQDRVKEGKSYMGLLPVGDYKFAEKIFTIVPGGDTIRVEIGRKQGTEMTRRSSGEKAPFRFTYIGPRADIGLAWTQAADASGGGAQPGDFSGPGARIGGGIELGLGGGWAVIGQVGYQNLFGSPGDAAGALENDDGFTVRSDAMHMGYGWLAGALRMDDLWLAVGPTYAIGTGGVTGVNELCVDEPSSAKCETVGDVSGEILRHSRMTGTIRAGGAALGASYAMWTVGPLEAAISLNAGAQSDLSRWYPWTTVSVTFAPPGSEDGG